MGGRRWFVLYGDIGCVRAMKNAIGVGATANDFSEHVDPPQYTGVEKLVVLTQFTRQPPGAIESSRVIPQSLSALTGTLRIRIPTLPLHFTTTRTLGLGPAVGDQTTDPRSNGLGGIPPKRRVGQTVEFIGRTVAHVS